MSSVMEANFDSMEALWSLLGFDDAPEPAMSYLRRLAEPDVKRQLAPTAATRDVFGATEEGEAVREQTSGRPATKAKARG